ncbi:hypothetical protein BL5915_07890 [Bifidobacterium longum subsp. longum]|uniref:Uncharacterized protein n=1 Tax=Bifidobacterium longum subsp. longum TaxID=1679 RepID=A0A7L9UKQ3_BIFLL|nr:hypothetical protein [Bifidobacterium longum]QOL54725.1 hypothetical protein BL5915_07890 [Bifidobacterium longum subsp. longum]
MDFDKGSPAYPDGTPATPVTNDGSELGTGKGDGERTLNYKYTGKGYILAEKVAAGTEIRVRLQINAKEVVGCRESGCKLTFYDSFDYTNKFLPSKGVVIRNGDRTYTDGVKVAWTEVPAVQGDDDKEPDTWHFNSTPDDEMPVDWSDGMPTEADVEEADDMSVKASYEITPEQAASDDPWEAVFYVRMQEGTNYSQDHMFGVVETKDGNAVKGNYSGAVDGVSVLPMYATASESVSVTDAQGGYRSAARPGDTLEYGLSSNVKNVKVYDGFKARFTACADPWLTGFRLPEYETDEWDMTALDKSKAVENGCAVGSTPLLFDHKGKATYTEMSLSLYWTAKVSNFANASRTISSPARIEASTPASHGLKADKAVSEWSSDPAPVESRLGTEGMLTSASESITRAEAGADGLRYEWNIYNNLTGLAGEVRTVIKLPSNDDSKLANGGKGPDGTWNGYDRGGSKFTDYVLAGEPRLDDAGTITSQGEQAAAWLGGGDWDTGDRLAKAFDARFAATFANGGGDQSKVGLADLVPLSREIASRGEDASLAMMVRNIAVHAKAGEDVSGDVAVLSYWIPELPGMKPDDMLEDWRGHADETREYIRFLQDLGLQAEGSVETLDAADMD